MYFVTLDMILKSLNQNEKISPEPRFHETGHSDTILTLVLEKANVGTVPQNIIS